MNYINLHFQLLDFRVVVARMLSLDVTTLSIPDFEIISRLEALIRNHHVTAAAHASIQAPLEALDPRFVKGFREAAVHSAPLHRYRRSQGGRTVSPRRPQSPNAKRYWKVISYKFWARALFVRLHQLFTVVEFSWWSVLSQIL